MTWIQQTLAVTVAVTLLCVISYMAGGSAVQKEWDESKARQEAVVSHIMSENARNLAALKEKHNKEVQHAKSKAGRDAVARYLRERGLLPDCATVRGGTDSGQAKIPEGVDGATSESGLAERLRAFTGRCADDARRVRLCTEWASREGLPVE